MIKYKFQLRSILIRMLIEEIGYETLMSRIKYKTDNPDVRARWRQVIRDVHLKKIK